jgi:hypothetical protein
MIDMNELARCWGARDWNECSTAIRAGYGWALKLNHGTVLVYRESGRVVEVEDWRAVSGNADALE